MGTPCTCDTFTSNGIYAAVSATNNNNGSGNGIESYSHAAYGVYSTGWTAGVYGTGTVGIWGDVTGSYVAVKGTNTGGTNGTGGDFECTGTGSCGVYAKGSNYALYGVGFGYFSGYVTKAGGGFRIDHPTKPETHYLNHEFVESDTAKNRYSGNAMLDANGEATITMPEWFSHVNGDPSMTVTAWGKAAVTGCDQVGPFTFKAFGPANSKVSWAIECPRVDKWQAANHPGVEIEKPTDRKGFFMHPEVFGHGKDKSEEPRVRDSK